MAAVVGSEASGGSNVETTFLVDRARLYSLRDTDTELGDRRPKENVRLTVVHRDAWREFARERFEAPLADGSRSRPDDLGADRSERCFGRQLPNAAQSLQR